MFKKLAKLNDIEDGLIKVIQTRYVRIAITKISDQIIAFEDICTHDGEAISSGKMESGCIICPRHFAKFDLQTGKAMCMPATENLTLFKTRISGDDLEVDIEE